MTQEMIQSFSLPAILILIYLLLSHWVADFIFQTHDMAINKSISNKWLFRHVLVYTNVMTGVMLLFFGFDDPNIFIPKYCIFWVITFIAHFCTDWVTSRLVKKRFDKKDFHNGFVIIGLDQILHYLQLLFTVYILVKKG
jgi:uncharacterized membrane protein